MNLYIERKNWPSITQGAVVLGDGGNITAHSNTQLSFFYIFIPLVSFDFSLSAPASNITRYPWLCLHSSEIWTGTLCQPALCCHLHSSLGRSNMSSPTSSLRVWHWHSSQYICRLKSIPARKSLCSLHLCTVSGLSLVLVLAWDCNKGRERVGSLHCGFSRLTCG